MDKNKNTQSNPFRKFITTFISKFNTLMLPQRPMFWISVPFLNLPKIIIEDYYKY